MIRIMMRGWMALIYIISFGSPLEADHNLEWMEGLSTGLR